MTITGAQALSFQPAVGSWRNLVGTTFGWLARAAGQASSPVLVQNKPLRPRQALVRPRQAPVLTKQPSQEQQYPRFGSEPNASAVLSGAGHTEADAMPGRAVFRTFTRRSQLPAPSRFHR